MDHLVHNEHDDEFESFIDTAPPTSSGDPYKTCTDKSVVMLEMKIPMYWCNVKLFKKNQSDEYGTVEGFFCAGSQTAGRVFAFRPVTKGSQEVKPVGELNDVDVILKYASGGTK